MKNVNILTYIDELDSMMNRIFEIAKDTRDLFERPELLLEAHTSLLFVECSLREIAKRQDKDRDSYFRSFIDESVGEQINKVILSGKGKSRSRG